MPAKKKPTSKSAKPAAEATAENAASKPLVPVEVPGVNTAAAASSAAAFLAARVKAQKPPATSSESASFKKLKAGLNQPAASSPFGQANKAGTGNSIANAFKSQGQQSHSTNAANVARTGVPRRTSGG